MTTPPSDLFGRSDDCATTATIVVPVYGDRLAEPTEYFFVRLSDPVNAFIANGQGIGTITDDEPRIRIGNATVVEGHEGTTPMTFTVSLSAAYDAPVTVDFATADGSATAGSDYEARTGTVVFAAGQTAATIEVLVYGDRIAEWNEFFMVQLSNPSPNAHVGGHWQYASVGYGTIIDDEPRISIDYSAYVNEGNTGATGVTFTVRLSTASDEPVSVNYSTAEGDTQHWYWNWYYYYAPPAAATADVDYQSQSGTLTFAPGETAKTITIQVYGDRIAEPDEAFSVNLSGAVGGVISGGHAVGLIMDDEPRISVGHVYQKEGSSGVTYFTFTVSLSVAYDQPVTVRYATRDGTATAGSDYEATSGVLTFAPGETTRTVTVAVYGDTAIEYDEYFWLVLSDPSDNASISNGWGVGTILNDDAATGGGGGNNGNGKGGKKK